MQVTHLKEPAKSPAWHKCRDFAQPPRSIPAPADAAHDLKSSLARDRKYPPNIRLLRRAARTRLFAQSWLERPDWVVSGVRRETGKE
jgi:hypothetical protein